MGSNQTQIRLASFSTDLHSEDRPGVELQRDIWTIQQDALEEKQPHKTTYGLWFIQYLLHFAFDLQFVHLVQLVDLLVSLCNQLEIQLLQWWRVETVDA